MGELIAAKFSDLPAARSATTALGEHRDPSVTIYAYAILYKNSDWRISVSDRMEHKGHATAVAALIGALAGLAVSPLLAVVGAVGGALTGTAAESTDREARADLVKAVAQEVGSNAVLVVDVAPADADSVRALIQNLGGTILQPSHT
jgi:uncharacterized membrane protein